MKPLSYSSLSVVLAASLSLMGACGGSGPEAGAPKDGGDNSGGSGGANGEEACAPAREKTVVSLTYDDAMPTQIRIVAPALKAHGLPATFFVTDVRSNPEPWAALKADGHELAAHTFNHPCPGTNSWVAEGKGNEDYDMDRMAQELDEGLVMLKDLGQEPPYTFAYPCGTTWVGESQESYIPLIETRFSAARGVTPGVASAGSSRFEIPSYFLKTTGEDLIARASGAKGQGSWVVYGFHGVGGDWETISEEAHEMLLQFLEDNAEDFVVLPFGSAARCVLGDATSPE